MERKPILVRWVVINKGNKTNYNAHARLVAKHIVAKYGGKRIARIRCGNAAARDGLNVLDSSRHQEDQEIRNFSGE